MLERSGCSDWRQTGAGIADNVSFATVKPPVSLKHPHRVLMDIVANHPDNLVSRRMSPLPMGGLEKEVNLLAVECVFLTLKRMTFAVP